MTEGSVADTCKAAGLNAVCPGKECPWYSSRCKTEAKNPPLSVSGSSCSCSYLNPVSEVICGKETKAVNCPKLNRVFTAISNWQNNEFGVVDGKSCEAGWRYTSTPTFQLFAYCYKQC